MRYRHETTETAALRKRCEDRHAPPFLRLHLSLRDVCTGGHLGRLPEGTSGLLYSPSPIPQQTLPLSGPGAIEGMKPPRLSPGAAGQLL
jgi:hypothetical protein